MSRPSYSKDGSGAYRGNHTVNKGPATASDGPAWQAEEFAGGLGRNGHQGGDWQRSQRKSDQSSFFFFLALSLNLVRTLGRP